MQIRESQRRDNCAQTTARNSQELEIDGQRRCGKLSYREGKKLSARSGTFAEDLFGGRHPTSHERLTGLPWDAWYRDGPAPWDIGQPQPAIMRLASEGGFAGAVLDAGCGTGENALRVASLGLSVLGVDVAETALAIARKKADERGIKVEFAAGRRVPARAFGAPVWNGAGLRAVPQVRRWRASRIRGESGVGDRARWNRVCVVLQ